VRTTVGSVVEMVAPIRVTQDVAASPERSWNVLVDTRLWARWGPSITAVDLHGDGTIISGGSTGRVLTIAGIWLPFEITEFVAGQRWAWSIQGIGATGHEVRDRPGGSQVVFTVPLLAAPYAVVCRIALDRVRRLAESTEPVGE